MKDKIEIKIDLDVAMAQFKKRKEANAKVEQVNNSDLPAGSPMYFYCLYCGGLTDCLPESYIGKPRRVCEPCEVLRLHGLI